MNHIWGETRFPNSVHYWRYILGDGGATQPYSWLDLNEHAANDLTQCSRSSPTLEIEPNSIRQGRGSIGEAHKAVGRPQWTGLTTFAATMMRAVQKECSMLWRSRGRHAVPSTLYLSWVKRKVRLAVNAVTGAHWPTHAVAARARPDQRWSFGKIWRNPRAISGPRPGGALMKC